MTAHDDEEERPPKFKKFHVDGAGARPDGTNSGYAWVYLDTDIQRIRRTDGWTNNQAEYKALIAVLKYVARGSHVVIFTDSQLLCEQFAGRYAVRNQQLALLLSEARTTIVEKKLDVKVRWIHREANLAGRLLDRGNG